MLFWKNYKFSVCEANHCYLFNLLSEIYNWLIVRPMFNFIDLFFCDNFSPEYIMERISTTQYVNSLLQWNISQSITNHWLGIAFEDFYTVTPLLTFPWWEFLFFLTICINLDWEIFKHSTSWLKADLTPTACEVQSCWMSFWRNSLQP